MFKQSPEYKAILKHENEDCEICRKEELKSFGRKGAPIKLNRTKLLNQIVLPQNECMFCKSFFDNVEDQLEHLTLYHKCEHCSAAVKDQKEHEKDEHECRYCGAFLRKKDHAFRHEIYECQKIPVS